MKFLVSVETTVEINTIKDFSEAKQAAMDLVQDALNGSPANKFQFYVVDAEEED